MSTSPSPLQLSLVRMEHKAERLHAARRWQREHKEYNRFPATKQVDGALTLGWGKSWKATVTGIDMPRWRPDDKLTFDERKLAPNQVAWFRRMVGEPRVQYTESEEQHALRLKLRPRSEPNRRKIVDYPEITLSGMGSDLLAAARKAAQAPRYRIPAGTVLTLWPTRQYADEKRFRKALPTDLVFLASELVDDPKRSPRFTLFRRGGWTLQVARDQVEVAPSFREAAAAAYEAERWTWVTTPLLVA